MDDEKLKYQIGANIAAYRKQAGLTQAGLAEKLNYSDKAVSKWERGESVPDVLTLVVLAEQFGITVNDLLKDPNELPGNPGTLEKGSSLVAESTFTATTISFTSFVSSASMEEDMFPVSVVCSLF